MPFQVTKYAFRRVVCCFFLITSRCDLESRYSLSSRRHHVTDDEIGWSAFPSEKRESSAGNDDEQVARGRLLRGNVTRRHSEMFETTFMARKKVGGWRGARAARLDRGTVRGAAVARRPRPPRAPPPRARRIPQRSPPSEFIQPRHSSALPELARAPTHLRILPRAEWFVLIKKKKKDLRYNMIRTMIQSLLGTGQYFAINKILF